MNSDDLGPQPDPVIEEGEPNPGGADALPDDDAHEVLARDLDPEANPVAQDVVPDEITAPDDEKTQEPDEDESKDEPPA